MEWQETKLQDICEFKTGKLNSNAAVENGIYPFFTCSPDALKINSYSFDTEAVLLAGNNAEGKFNVKLYKGKFDAYQRTYVINANNKNLLNIKYLFYSLGLQLNYLKTVSIGTATKFLTMSILNNIKIPLPPLTEQRAIAEILSSIDDKIELNNQMNRTLEATAQGIFKQWFVDYEFPTNQASAPLSQRGDTKKNNSNSQRSLSGAKMSELTVTYKSSGGKMIDSELGPIPEGWESVYYTDIINVLGGGTPSKKNDNYWNGTIPFFTPKDIEESAYIFNTEEHITEDGLSNCNSKLYKKNSVLITARGTVGKICMTGVDMAMNQSCYALIGCDGFNQYYVYEQTLDLISRLKQNSHGSVFNTITTDTFRKIKVIKPDINILSIYESVVSPLFDEIHNNTIQSQTLSTLRDSLLPKLMSAELRVPEDIVKRYGETAS